MVRWGLKEGRDAKFRRRNLGSGIALERMGDDGKGERNRGML
jgi:hypothetical protein